MKPVLEPGTRHYLFGTSEGMTFQPDSEDPEPDIENCQVLAFGSGGSPEKAWQNALDGEYADLLDTSFEEVLCYQLARPGPVCYLSLDEQRETMRKKQVKMRRVLPMENPQGSYEA